MFVRQISSQEIKKEIIAGQYNQSGTLALFTESMVALLSSKNSHQAFMDLVSLMGQTFPLSAPALYLDNIGYHARVYTMIERAGGEIKRPAGFSGPRPVPTTRCWSADTRPSFITESSSCS